MKRRSVSKGYKSESESLSFYDQNSVSQQVNPDDTQDNWSKDELALMKCLVKQYMNINDLEEANNFTDQDWEIIAQQLSNRSAAEIEFKWKVISKGPKYKKSSRWTPDEDVLLNDLVQALGSKQWQCIANELNNKFWQGQDIRKGKQCRERWINHLNPEITKHPFTDMEDILMIEKQIKNGNRWAFISTFIKGRTENQVKNRFKHILKKFVENKYGKEFFRKYSSESLKKTTLEIIGSKDKIVEELLEHKKMEMKNNPNSSQAYDAQMNTDTQMHSNGAINEYNLYQSSSAFRKVGKNLSKYSRNAAALQSMNSQPIYMNNSFDYVLNNDESIGLNKSIRILNNSNSTSQDQNPEFNPFPSNQIK